MSETMFPLNRKEFIDMMKWYEELVKEGNTKAKARDIVYKNYPKLHKVKRKYIDHSKTEGEPK